MWSWLMGPEERAGGEGCQWTKVREAMKAEHRERQQQHLFHVVEREQ